MTAIQKVREALVAARSVIGMMGEHQAVVDEIARIDAALAALDAETEVKVRGAKFIDPEWLKRKIEEDPDEGEIGAGFELFASVTPADVGEEPVATLIAEGRKRSAVVDNYEGKNYLIRRLTDELERAYRRLEGMK